jgi:hypothetical protein
LGHQQLATFADRTEPEFSVGFVSVGAGVLLAARLMRRAITGEVFRGEGGSSLALTFLNPGFLWFAEPKAADCDCQTRLKAAWEAHWL